MKQLKLMKFELEYPSKSGLIVFSGKFGPPGFHCKKLYDFRRNHPKQVDSFKMRPWKKNQASCFGETRAWESRESKLKIILAFLNKQDYNAGTELMAFQLNAPLKVQNFSIATLVEEISLQLHRRLSFNIKVFKLISFWLSENIRIPMQSRKSTILFPRVYQQQKVLD